MAQYFTDFSEYTTGVQPSDWTKRWDTGDTITVETDAGATGGQALRVVTGTAATAASWDAIDSDANRSDVEILSRIKEVSGGGTYTKGVLARASDPESTRTGYWANIGGGLRLSRYLSGDFDNFAQGSFSGPGSLFYFIRARWNGSSIKAKAWGGTLDDEPASWSLDMTNTDISQAGWVGLFNFQPGTYDYDFFGVGTNGDPAPTAPVASGPNTPINPGTTNLLSTSVRLTWDQG
jgi:hypothetical protein